MKDHHVCRNPWFNRRRLRKEAAMDTIFMAIPGWDGSTCGQVFVGQISRIFTFYPMPSQASVYIIKAYQDFMRYEGVPEGVHCDLAPEQKVEKNMQLNKEMVVKDT